MHRRLGRAVATFWGKAYKDNLTGLSSMVAYSLLLSIFPLALIALFVGGRVLRSPELANSVIADVQRIFPPAARGTITSGVRRLEHASTTVGLVAVVSSLWVSASFWGALDTAFCRIYQLPCRTWVRQKLFGLGMLVVVLVLIAASVLVPTLQAVLVNGASDLPLGLEDLHRRAWDREEVHQVFDTLQFRVLRDRLYATLEAAEPEADAEIEVSGEVLAADAVAPWLDAHLPAGARAGGRVTAGCGAGVCATADVDTRVPFWTCAMSDSLNRPLPCKIEVRTFTRLPAEALVTVAASAAVMVPLAARS